MGQMIDDVRLATSCRLPVTFFGRTGGVIPTPAEVLTEIEKTHRRCSIMAVVFERPKSLLDVPTHFCPGCGHGIVHRLVCEVLDEMNIEGDTIGVVPVGCSVMSYNYFGCDVIEAPHGRAPAVATGVKRTNPDKMVFSYQGDGDLAAIGTAETVHVATRGENIVIIFINNTTYGMTGGQMAPTTLPGQVTQTTPYGRKHRNRRLSDPGLRDARDLERNGTCRACGDRQCTPYPCRTRRQSARHLKTRRQSADFRSSRFFPHVRLTGDFLRQSQCNL